MNVFAKLNGNKTSIIKKVLIAIAVVFFLFVIISPFQQIDIGECGIIYNSITGKVSKECIDSGWHLVIPLIHKLTVYPIIEQTYGIARDSKAWLNGQDLSFGVTTSDNQKINIDIYYTFSLNEEYLPAFFKKYAGKSLQTVEVDYYDNVFRNSTIQVINKYQMLDVYSEKRNEIQNNVYSLLEKELARDGVSLSSVLIKEVRLSPEAEAILRADSKRQADIIEAQGKSEANKILGNSLNDNIIRLQILEKLSPNLELIILPDAGENSIDLENIYNNIINSNVETQGNKDDK